jgi:hypothetical protein
MGCHLRAAFLHTFRQGVVEDHSARETHKQLQQRWGDVAGNVEGQRFVDGSGRRWDNAQYLQMLTPTTASRVSRESYIDTLVESGFKLARIPGDGGENCPICDAWEGVIVQIAGESDGAYPTYQDALDAGCLRQSSKPFAKRWTRPLPPDGPASLRACVRPASVAG